MRTDDLTEPLERGETDGVDQAQELEVLRSSGRLVELEGHRPAKTFLRALGLSRDEVAHTRVLAFLLDARTSAVAIPFARQLILGGVQRSVPR